MALKMRGESEIQKANILLNISSAEIRREFRALDANLAQLFSK